MARQYIAGDGYVNISGGGREYAAGDGYLNEETTGGGASSWTITPSGGVTFAGAPAIEHGKVFPVDGGVIVAGTAAMLRGRVYAPDGGVEVGGAAPLTFSGTRIITPTGGVEIGGASSIQFSSPNGRRSNAIKRVTSRVLGHKGFELWRKALH